MPSKFPQCILALQNFFAAIADPWSSMASGACIPLGNNRESQKVRGFARITVTVGTGQIGWVIVCPCLANDSITIYYTNNTYTGQQIIPYTSSNATPTIGTGVSTVNLTNLPYASTAFTNTGSVGDTSPNVSGRIVSAGLSAQYTGTVSAMGGLMYCLTEPTHLNLGGYSVTEFGQYAETDIARVTDKKCWNCAFGVNERELNFTDNLNYNLATNTTTGNFNNITYPYSNNAAVQFVGPTNSVPAGQSCPMGIMFTGTSGNTFQVEYVQHTEYVGQGVGAVSTENHRDEAGARMVLAAAAKAPAEKQARQCDWACAISNSFASVVQDEGPAVLRTGANMVTGLIASLIL